MDYQNIIAGTERLIDDSRCRSAFSVFQKTLEEQNGEGKRLLEFVFDHGGTQEIRALVHFGLRRDIELGEVTHLQAFNVFEAIDSYSALAKAEGR